MQKIAKERKQSANDPAPLSKTHLDNSLKVTVL